MKYSYNKTFQCAVFGHNYEKSKNYPDKTSELTCVNCNTQVKTDAQGNFVETSISNKDVQTTLRKLYHLKLRAHKPTFSS